MPYEIIQSYKWSASLPLKHGSFQPTYLKCGPGSCGLDFSIRISGVLLCRAIQKFSQIDSYTVSLYKIKY